jgi:hypothetical protein
MVCQRFRKPSLLRDGGSIPQLSATLRSLRELRLGEPPAAYRSEASEGCRARSPQGEGGRAGYQFAISTDVLRSLAGELEASALFVQGQAPGAGQAHTLTPKGTVGSIPTPATNTGNAKSGD